MIIKVFPHYTTFKKEPPQPLFFKRTKDHLIPVETGRYYKVADGKKWKVRCGLKNYHEGEGHGFFNYKNFKHIKRPFPKADLFLLN